MTSSSGSTARPAPSPSTLNPYTYIHEGLNFSRNTQVLVPSSNGSSYRPGVISVGDTVGQFAVAADSGSDTRCPTVTQFTLPAAGAYPTLATPLYIGGNPGLGVVWQSFDIDGGKSWIQTLLGDGNGGLKAPAISDLRPGTIHDTSGNYGDVSGKGYPSLWDFKPGDDAYSAVDLWSPDEKSTYLQTLTIDKDANLKVDSQVPLPNPDPPVMSAASSLADATAAPSATSPHPTLRPFNNGQTGFVDLAVSDPANNRVLLYLNDGSAHFSLGKTFSMGAGSLPGRVVVADLLGNGNPDLVIPLRGSGLIRVLQPAGKTGANADFTTTDIACTTVGPAVSATNPAPIAIAAGDVFGEGKAQLFVLGCQPAP